jgi:hypothetical protein
VSESEKQYISAWLTVKSIDAQTHYQDEDSTTDDLGLIRWAGEYIRSITLQFHDSCNASTIEMVQQIFRQMAKNRNGLANVKLTIEVMS